MTFTDDDFKERAEKIYKRLLGVTRVADDDESCIEAIAAEIREAVEEARHVPMKTEEIREREFGCGHDADCSCYADRLRQQAKAAAYEGAAKLIEAQIIWTPDGVRRLVEQIRALAKGDEMSFNDEDLMVLQAWTGEVGQRPFDLLPEGKLKALIARMEAAENKSQFAKHEETCPAEACNCGLHETDYAWRKAAGK